MKINTNSGHKLRVHSRKIIIIFFFSTKTYDDSLEHPKHMLKIMGKKIFTILHKIFVYLNICKLLVMALYREQVPPPVLTSGF